MHVFSALPIDAPNDPTLVGDERLTGKKIREIWKITDAANQDRIAYWRKLRKRKYIEIKDDSKVKRQKTLTATIRDLRYAFPTVLCSHYITDYLYKDRKYRHEYSVPNFN